MILLALVIGIPTVFAGVEDRVDVRQQRRQDTVENTADRVEDKQDFREERRYL